MLVCLSCLAYHLSVVPPKFILALKQVADTGLFGYVHQVADRVIESEASVQVQQVDANCESESSVG